jgi:hypothetical protein
MMLDQFIKELRQAMKNPNAIAVSDNTIYLFTNNCELIALRVEEPKVLSLP